MDKNYKQITLYASNRLGIQIDDELLKRISKICEVKTYKKGDLIITAGEVVSTPYFLLSGLMRTFYLDIDGNEVTNYFIFENTFYGSNYITVNKPSFCNFEALEDCVSLEFDGMQMANLIKTEHIFSLLYMSILEDALIEKKERETSLITKSATERYLDLRRHYPNIEERVNQTHIASYLGITPVSLSRIRRVLRDDSY